MFLEETKSCGEKVQDVEEFFKIENEKMKMLIEATELSVKADVRKMYDETGEQSVFPQQTFFTIMKMAVVNMYCKKGYWMHYCLADVNWALKLQLLGLTGAACYRSCPHIIEEADGPI